MRRRDWAAWQSESLKSAVRQKRAAAVLADITARGLRWQDSSVARARIEGDIKSTDQIAAISTFA